MKENKTHVEIWNVYHDEGWAEKVAYRWRFFRIEDPEGSHVEMSYRSQWHSSNSDLDPGLDVYDVHEDRIGQQNKRQFLKLWDQLISCFECTIEMDHRRKSPEELIAALNDFGRSIGVQWQSRLGASENYCLVIRSELAEAKGITTIEDLTRVASDLVFTADPEFLNRRDGYVGLSSAYDLDFRRVEPCRVTARYAMLDGGEADVFVGYETDPEIQSPKLNLKVLEDSDGYFPDYHALPVVSTEALQRVAGLQSALDRLKGCISTPELVRLVQRIQNCRRDPAKVRKLAQEFIQKKQLAGELGDARSAM
jgi:hypothetical protein